MVIRFLIAILLACLSSPAYATVYWAKPTGSPNTSHNITGSGAFCNTIRSTDTSHVDQTRQSIPSAFGTIGSAVACAQVAGDVVNISGNDGVYTSSANNVIKTDSTSITPSSGLASGTSESNRTIVQGVPGDSTPDIRGISGLEIIGVMDNARRNFLTFRNLKLNGTGISGSTGGPSCMNVSGGNITVDNVEVTNCWMEGITAHGDAAFGCSGNSHLTIRNSHIHETGYNQGPNTGRGSGYGYYGEAQDLLFENNEVDHVTGEYMQIAFQGGNPGCNAARPVVRNNYFHDMYVSSATTGQPLRCGQAFAVNGSDVKIYNNIVQYGCANLTPSGGVNSFVTSSGPCIVTPEASNGRVFIWNNIFIGYNSALPSVGIQLGSCVKQSGSEVFNNVFLTYGGTPVSNSSGFTVTSSTNTSGGSITDCFVSSSDYTLKSGSTCINAGTQTINEVLAYNGSAPDRGPFESFSATSAQIDTNVMDISLGMNKNVPVLPAGSISGFTVACSGGGVCGTPVVASAVRKSGSSSVIRLTISGIGGGGSCDPGQTWTWSYTPGNVTDSAYVGNPNSNYFNQSMHGASNQAVTEICTGAGTSPPSSDIHYLMDEGTGTTLTDADGGDENGTRTNSPTWVTGGLSFSADSNEYVAVPYGNTINASSQSLTMCADVEPISGDEAISRIVAGTVGSSQRYYLGRWNGFWGIGIGTGSISESPSTQFAVASGRSLICVVGNATSDTATLWVNGVKGTGDSVKSTYTGFSLGGNLQIGATDYSFLRGGNIVYEWWLFKSAATDQNMADLFNSWNQVSAPVIGTFSQVTHQFQLLRLSDVSAPVNYRAVGANANVVAAGAVAIIFQTDCTAANCDPISQRLMYSRNSGTFLPVPDLCGSDGVCFYGQTNDSNIVNGVVSCCLSGVLTANSGTTVFTSSAIPSFDLTQNSSIVQRYVIQFTETTVGTTFDFKIEHQNGTDFNSYTPSSGARATIEAVSLGAGF